MKRLVPVCAVAMLVSFSPAIAGEGTVWIVDYEQSSVSFAGTQEGEPFNGSFGSFTADIVFDPAHPESGSIKAVIAMASAGADSSDIEDSLPTSDWFATKAHPTATFESTDITGSDGDYEAAGTLSLKGIEKAVILPFMLEIEGDTALAHGQIDLTRTDYDVGSGSFSSGDWVGLTVTVTVDITASRTN